MFGNKLIISSHGYKLTFRESVRERERERERYFYSKTVIKWIIIHSLHWLSSCFVWDMRYYQNSIIIASNDSSWRLAGV